MEQINLTDPLSRRDYFQQGVLANLRYWLGWVKERLTDVAAIDQEQNLIIRAISFALDLKDLAWETTRELIELLSPYMERRGYWDSWSRILDRASHVAQQFGDSLGLARVSSLLARLRARQSRFDEARLNYRHAIKLSRQIGDRVTEARACSNLGYYFIEQGYWWRAEVLCWHALRIFEQLDHNHGRAHTENHLGILYIRQGFWDRAQAHLEQACALWRSMEDGSGLMLGYMNLGMLFNEMEHFDEALSYHHQALFYAEQAGEELIVGTIHMNTGNCLRLMGRFAEAKACCLKAKVIFDRFKNSVGQGLVLDNLGLIYLGQSQGSKAKSALEAAVEVWRNLQNRHNEIRAMTYLLEYALTTENERLARIWLAETEALLNRYDRAGTYQQLWQKVDRLRRSLKGSADGANCGEV